MKTKWLISVLLIVVITIMHAGCSDDSKSDSDSQAAAKEVAQKKNPPKWKIRLRIYLPSFFVALMVPPTCYPPMGNVYG